MHAASFTHRLTQPQLRLWLVLLFLLLAAPITALVWHAYGQLKWEAFHQSRGLAEELSRRINANFSDYLEKAESRSFADYSYLVVAGDTSSPFLQRSPLSELPVVDDIPGTIGYFQIDTDGQFSTPVLPNSETPPESVGIGASDLKTRQTLAAQLMNILSENQLVAGLTDRENMVAITVADAFVDDIELEELSPVTNREKKAAVAQESAKPQKPQGTAESVYSTTDGSGEKINSQLAFDKLKNLGSTIVRRPTPSVSGSDAMPELSVAVAPSTVQDLGLDLRYEERVRTEETLEDNASSRFTRKEQNYVPEPVPIKNNGALAESVSVQPEKDEVVDVDVDVSEADSSSTINVEPLVETLASRRITAFESEIDPIEFSLLDSGHFVAYRKVWRDRERLIQGVLVDRQVLIDQLIRKPFQQAHVSSMSALSLIYQNDVLSTFRRNTQKRYVSRDTELQGTLLYRNRLADPLNALELVFSIKQLPPGPGARVLAGVTAALAVVLLGGFYLLYRTGVTQIVLGNQQQDFVSAVSHELKTPLTSIRLYGELLKEGWASEDKKQQYYTFIHDESERLSRLIENVLKLAHINRNELVLDLQPIAISDLMATIQATLQQQAENSGFDVLFNIQTLAGSTVVVVDRDSILQIMVNLLDNAIKFSKYAERKDIEISAIVHREGKVSLTVRDYGPGIPKNQLKNIFRMFYRSENELTRETVGTGIGLAIVHQLCVAMQADVEVMNLDPGVEFLVSLPKQTVRA